MKRTLTRMISAVCAAALGIGCMAIGADAKVIEPEIVKTESWTTSYYIDDDMDTLYPYIQCEADIYNDGTIKLYMWNTHEWDGFATVSHTVTIINTIPESIDSKPYAFWSGNIPDNLLHIKRFENVQDIVKDMSYYPSEYKHVHPSFSEWSTRYVKLVDDPMVTNNNLSARFPIRHVPLSNLSFYETRKDNLLFDTFTPTVDPTGTYNFRLYGHDITITPELLSGSIIAEPQLTEQEQKIKALEAENAALKATLAAIDSDSDDLLTAADAQAVLNYYVAYLAGKVSGKVSDYAEYSKQKG